jgi:hypothetical protein
MAVPAKGAAAVLHSQGACTADAGAGLYSAELQPLVGAAVHRLVLLGVLQLHERGSVPVVIRHPALVASSVGAADLLEGMT